MPNVVIQGLDELRAVMRRFGQVPLQLVGNALYREAEEIMTEAKGLCPVDTGALRASGQVRLPTVDGQVVTVEMGFGNSAVGYAVYVHEDLAAHHDVGQAKYLEQPLLEHAGGMGGRLADAVVEMLRAAR